MFASKIICLIILVFSLSGCFEKQIEIQTLPEERIKLNLEEPDQLQLKPVTFYVMTEQNKDAVFKQLEAQNKDKVIIGLSDEDYQKISENLVQIQNYIVHQRHIINAYKEYYEPIKQLSEKRKD